MLNQIENLVLEKDQEIQITRTHNDMLFPNSGPRGQPPPGQGPIGLYIPRNATRQQATIFTAALNTEKEIPKMPNIIIKGTFKDRMHGWMLKGFDQIPVGKDDEDQYWPGFGPSELNATDWRKSKQQGLEPSMDDVRAL
ncbi:MAG: hypothetical protein EZS28_027523 [Streblomastix strix]|uniref:Uncharacterized protein n=1 Tax=Streblomastix strix TaxID=222440 RepID=A0A5J4V2I3_9EUKA|nr:MAG: hypothetical protein EZS28_027523 [Streblomastix strix]